MKVSKLLESLRTWVNSTCWSRPWSWSWSKHIQGSRIIRNVHLNLRLNRLVRASRVFSWPTWTGTNYNPYTSILCLFSQDCSGAPSLLNSNTLFYGRICPSTQSGPSLCPVCPTFSLSITGQAIGNAANAYLLIYSHFWSTVQWTERNK